MKRMRAAKKTLTVLAACLGLLVASLAVPASAQLPAEVKAPAVAEKALYFPPIGFQHFTYPTACLQDLTYGWYPAQLKVIANGYYNGPNNFDLWYAPPTNGSICSGFETRQRVQVALVKDTDSWKYSWCAHIAGSYNSSTGEWIYDPEQGFPTRIYINYYRLSCRDGGETELRNLMSATVGWVIGLEDYHGGSDYSVMNLDRQNIPWPTVYDYLSVNRIYG